MKKMNKKGFTLMEMLIVIAIIAILIAIAIPTFTSALEKSRQRTDQANVRSLKSLAVADYMSEGGIIKAAQTSGDTETKGPCKCWLLKGGQKFAAQETAPTDAVPLEAKWEKASNGWTRAESDVYVNLTINTADNGTVYNTIPRLADDGAAPAAGGDDDEG